MEGREGKHTKKMKEIKKKKCKDHMELRSRLRLNIQIISPLKRKFI